VIVDAHHHFWRYDPVQYGWIGDSMARLRRDFLPADLEKEIKPVGVDAVVSVQARQIVEETEQLLKYAEGNAFIAGVVGWVPLVDPGVEKDIERFAARPKLKAMRHVLQDEDASYMLRDDFNRGVAALARHGLAYDVLIYERQLPQAIELVDRHPGHRFILDHIAKPRIREGELEPWRANLRRLAERPNVWCKVSGMVTEADFKAWTEAQLQPYLEATLEAFGPRRLMLGSDWPVCLAACEYGRWVSIVRRFAGRLSKAEQERVLGGTAAEAYRL
jgi:L-fuconolactonase